MNTHALSRGIIVKGNKHDYRIVDLLRYDGMGFTYKAEIVPEQSEASQGHGQGATSQPVRPYVVIREHFMPHCSTRGADGITVETPEEIAPTVKACLEAFEKSSFDRRNVSVSCRAIIDVIETFESNNTFYYVVEFLDGETLEEYVKGKGPLKWDEVRDILSPIFDAVRSMHNRHLIHNTITPNHIRFTTSDDKRFPILFSLYSTIGFDDNGMRQWTVPVITCQDGYASPEQYSSMEHFSPATDIYSLAATLVFCLSGRSLPPAVEVNEQVIRKTLPPDVPENRVKAIINALNPDPNSRTQSVSAFREELSEFYGGNKRKRREDENIETESWKDVLKNYHYPIAIIIVVILAMIFLSIF